MSFSLVWWNGPQSFIKKILQNDQPKRDKPDKTKVLRKDKCIISVYISNAFLKFWMTNIPDCYPYYNWKTIFMVTVILNQKLIAQYLHLHAVKNLENFNLCQNRRERERACQESGLYWPLYLELKLVSLGYALYGFEVCPFGLNFPMMWRTSCLLG